MPIDYAGLAKKYQPKHVKTLIIGETPPPNGTSFFYLPKMRSKEYRLPSVVFRHYFGKLPFSADEYKLMLDKLTKNNIFVMFICDTPLRISNRIFSKGYDPEELTKLISHIPHLREKISSRGIDIPAEKIIFLPARNYCDRHIRKFFPNSQIISWEDFRTTHELLP